MKTIRRELREILLVHVAVVAFVCVTFLASALPIEIVSGPVVDPNQVQHNIAPTSYPYLP